MSLKIYPYPFRSNNGGTFFTMLIFIMMLISTALMYYYFHRARSLEKQIAALENGNAFPKNTEPGIFSFLPWNQEEENVDTDTPAPVAASTPALQDPKPAATSRSQKTPADDSLPPSGAVSTPRPRPAGTTDQAVANQSEPASESPASLDLLAEQQSEEIFPSEPVAGPEATTGNPQSETPEQNAADGEVNSMYDAPPQVRVRSPRRD